MGGGGNQPTYVTQDYSESMKSALSAQVEMAPKLYSAEADPEYGRKAYARLDQEIIRESLMGREMPVDKDGYVTSTTEKYDPNKFEKYNTKKEAILGRIKQFEPNYTEANIKESPLYKTIFQGDNTSTGTVWHGADNAGAPWGSEEPEHIEIRWNLWKQNHKNATGQDINLPKFGEGAPHYSKANRGQEADPETGIVKQYVGIEHAGGTKRVGGALEILGGDQAQKMSDGSFRKAGYDQNGNFLGASKMEQDLLELAKTQQINTETGLAEVFGKRLTQAYRESGDIQGALDKVKDLQQYESAITDGVETGGKSLFNLANQFTAPQIKSPYSSGGNQAQEQQQYTDPSDLGNPSGMSDGEKKLEANNRANFDSIQERYDQTLQDIEDGFGWTTKEKALEKYNQEMAQFKAEQPENFYKYSRENNLEQGTRGLADELQQGEEVQQDAMLNNYRQRRAGGAEAQAGNASPEISTRRRGNEFISSFIDANGQEQVFTGTDRDEVIAQAQSSMGGSPPQMSQGQGGLSQDLTQNRGVQSINAPTMTGKVSADSSGIIGAGVTADENLKQVNPTGTIADAGLGTRAVTNVEPFGSISRLNIDNRQEGLTTNPTGTIRDVSSTGTIRDVSGGRPVSEMQMGDLGGLRSAISTDAQNALALGGDLSARESRRVTENARIASTARGRSRDLSSILSEVNANEELSRQRLNERRQYASAVAGQEGQFRQADIAQNTQAQMANQQAGLQSSGANQQADLNKMQMGIQAGSANQQADLQQSQLGLQSQMANQDTILKARGLNYDAEKSNQQADIQARGLGIQAQSANQQADLSQMQMGLDASKSNQQADIADKNFSLQSQLANQQNQQNMESLRVQAGLGNQQADVNIMQAELQADLANQEFQNQSNQRNLQGQLANQRTQMELLNLEQQAQAGNAQAIQQLQALTFQGLNKDYDRDIALQQWNQQNYQQGLGMERGFAQSRVGLEQATSADGLLAVTGRGSGAGVGSGQGVYANGAVGLNSAPQLYNPSQGAQFMADQTAGLNNYNANIYSADQQRIAGMYSAVGNAVSGIAQGLGSAKGCWVAREVYGETNPTWLLFREYLFSDAPSWFRKLYMKFGERFAEFISDKPMLKNVIRRWMNSKIKKG